MKSTGRGRGQKETEEEDKGEIGKMKK